MCMCGITGWVNWNKDLSNEHVILKDGKSYSASRS